MKLTKEEFKELNHFFYYDCNSLWTLDEKLQRANDKGWIKKNATDEFIECYYQFKTYYDDYQGDSPAVKLAKAGMKAIEELQEKYENKKEE